MTITAPYDGALITEQDDTSSKPGIQANVLVQTDEMTAEAVLSLSFLSEAEQIYVWPDQALVDEAGLATFDDVTFPEGFSTLRVHYEGPCALQSQQISLHTRGPLPCELNLSPSPTQNSWYAPYSVVNQQHDSDPTLPGAQIGFSVWSMPGVQVTITESDPLQNSEQTLAQVGVGSGGTAALTVTLAEGYRAIKASCKSSDRPESVESGLAFYFVDVTPPACSLTNLNADQVITCDVDEVPTKEGTQLTATATYFGSDLSDQPTIFAVRYTNESYTVVGTAIDNGQTSATIMLWAPGQNQISVTGADLAGNSCVAEQTVIYAGSGAE